MSDPTSPSAERKESAKAFRWIVEILRQRQIPFQISGGLAARSYGATRPLADIDVDVAAGRLNEIADDVRPWIVFGPGRYHDAEWDLDMMTLRYEGQDIDICAVETERVRDARTGEWSKPVHDLSETEVREIFGDRVPVVSRASLVEYKNKLRRDVDKEDLRMLGQSL